MPTISVIVPIYKVEPYIRRCVDSVLSQTFTDFELILVDDGSPDNCPAICDEYVLKDNRIHVIHQKNGGLSAARNTGLDYACGSSNSKWISFVDSDDWIHPLFLEYLYKSVKEADTKIGACAIHRSDEETDFQNTIYNNKIMSWDTFYLNDWIQGVVAWNKLYDKSLFVGLRYPVGRIHEDEYLTYKLLAKAGIISFVDSKLYTYFQNPEGIIKRHFSLAKLDVIQALEEQCEFAKKNGYKELYDNKTIALLGKLATLLNECQNTGYLSDREKREGINYLRPKLRKLIFKEWKKVKKSKDKNWYLENAYPEYMWCYWTCVGIIGKIKRIVGKDV